MPQEWETLLRLAGIVAGQGADADIEALRRARRRRSRAAAAASSRIAQLRGPERLLDILLRSGPYDLDSRRARARRHGIDLGPLTERVPEVLRTPSPGGSSWRPR